MTHSAGVRHLATQIGVQVEHVASALRLVTRTHTALRDAHYRDLSDDQYRRLLAHDRYPLAIVGNIAMRMAGRLEDAHRLMSIYKASTGTGAHTPRLRRGTGTLPEHHDHPHVQQAIRILEAADLPPILTDGTRALRHGFQVLPSCDDELPGWLFLAPDPDAEHRTGFAGGHHGYTAVMRWAGWGVITAPLPEGLIPVCHPDHRHQPFPT